MVGAFEWKVNLHAEEGAAEGVVVPEGDSVGARVEASAPEGGAVKVEPSSSAGGEVAVVTHDRCHEHITKAHCMVRAA